MNKISFLDELVRLGGATRMLKQAYGGSEGTGETSTVDIPHGMVGSDPTPESIRVAPDEAATRLPETAKLPSNIRPGRLGGISQAKDPIDRFKFNRAYRDRR
jgi:hypothetical protein